MPQLPADTSVFLLFLLKAKAALISFRSAGEDCIVEIAFTNVNSFRLSMMLMQETCKKETKFPVTPPVLDTNTGLENQYLIVVDSSRPVLTCRDTPHSMYALIKRRPVIPPKKLPALGRQIRCFYDDLLNNEALQ